MNRAITEAKIWGTAKHVFSDPNAAVSILETVIGGYCSRHSHAQRVNRFIVHSGSIDVVEYTEDGEQETARTWVRPGEVYDVDAGVVHRFEVIQPGLVIEVYFPAKPGCKVSHDDIQRLDIGGRCISGLRNVL